MQPLHCGTCGGVIRDSPNVSYRLPRSGERDPPPSEEPCRCATPIVYGPPAGFASIPSMPSQPRPSDGTPRPGSS
jgi:hypothetical protein